MNIERIARLSLSLGFDPRKIVSVKNFPKYFSDRRKWKSLGAKISGFYPIVSDYDENAGSAHGHYFHQDLLVASFINTANPNRHVDIGSRVDGFVAHVAAFREIEVLDIRPLPDTGHENIKFIQADVMQPITVEDVNSISCLHAIEHFGLGRYGDAIDPNGHLKGFHNIVKCLQSGGRLYISFPISRQDEVHFNAHRTFHPRSILGWDSTKAHLDLERFDYVDDNGVLHKKKRVEDANDMIYGCGIYTFVKR